MPASAHSSIRPRNRKLKKSKPRIHTITTRNSGRKPVIPQSSVIPAPKTNEATNNRHSRSPSRYSSSDQITTANSSRSNISPVQLVARSQNVSCKPQTATASSGGNHALPVVRNEKTLVSRLRCASVRSCGSNATDRASRQSVSAAHTAENKFSASGTAASGSQRIGYVTRNARGFNTSGCHVQPDILATEGRLNNDTQRFSVSQ